MNENGVRTGLIRLFAARTRSLLNAATVAKKVNFPHPHADRGPAANSLTLCWLLRLLAQSLGM